MSCQSEPSVHVERIVFRNVLLRGELSFHDFMQYASVSKTRRTGIYTWIIEFLSREFNLNRSHWSLRFKALYLWFYLSGEGHIGFETEEIKEIFLSAKDMNDYDFILFITVKWNQFHDQIPDHMLIRAYQRGFGIWYRHG